MAPQRGDAGHLLDSKIIRSVGMVIAPLLIVAIGWIVSTTIQQDKDLEGLRHQVEQLKDVQDAMLRLGNERVSVVDRRFSEANARLSHEFDRLENRISKLEDRIGRDER